SLDLFRTTNPEQATELAKTLDTMNRQRRQEQDRIYEEATVQAVQYEANSVLVVSSENWSHGIIGIVAAKLLEKFKKPTFVLEEIGEEAKGSARSFGDFSAADAIRAADDIITKGGGHKFAAGVTLPTKSIADFRQRVNEYYQSQNLTGQDELLLPRADTEAEFSELTIEAVQLLSQLEPFGNGNPEPVLLSKNITVVNKRVMGDNGQHVKLTLKNEQGQTLDAIAFSAPEHFFVEPGERLDVWYHPMINSWNGSESVEGRLLHIETA
ncbi:MAG TPA: DHHA1 domain-containing protein, partial [Candidatus Saccharibacteria bacterium]|nr:DHHA1 domain-containing protein [Candidatus Saccharibacteria bacterium]